MVKCLFVLSLFVLLLAGCSEADIPQTYNPPAQKIVVPVEKKVEIPVRNIEFEKILKAIEDDDDQVESDVPLSNDNSYINVDGNKVHSPAYAPSRPSGASAKCRDGTYSFSQNRRGTCSHHGGVATWY